ncbi:DgsA anti-repressor MtfA [Algoriphagus kandeliae]|uniref:DgsA anti-repressor MtfA n=1 Tax=Algoriphagus kandeliae TaxID=2562278 RepID=A0A4Y9QQR2_9BACT|nr:zinc-dependent peptidase [Algoriphagus kandeliae]TFV93225.1 DgsA anti-repressor MtfA [Algoriphagus kandeliae]
MFFIELLSFVSESIWRIWRAIFHHRLNKEEVEVLNKYFPYYSQLRLTHQKEFKQRLEYLLTDKKFVARGNLLEITSEMKVLIGATIVQVTFGYPNVQLRHFKKILVYPDTYFSNISKAYHRGEVNPRLGIIVLSWSCFARGLADYEDGVNLGIHEVAHALKLENQIRYNGESDFFHPVIWTEYQELADEEQKLIRTGIDYFFRERGGEDSHEFFAVALENFFERSELFKARKPELYRALVRLLQQDPITLKSV